MIDIGDEVYGLVKIRDPLLCDLVRSRGLVRLKGVSQAGASRFVRSGRTVTRFEHSIGVMHLAGVLGGDSREMAAGLLQDVSHTAFSHTVDYLVGDQAETFHEQVYRASVLATDIPGVLKRHGLTIDEVTSGEVLSRRIDIPAPDLCADRIDYTLRDLRRFGRLKQDDCQRVVNHLVYREGHVCFDSTEVARDFSSWYQYLVTQLFMNPLELYAHGEFADLLRESIEGGLFTMQDLIASTDNDILESMRRSDYAPRFARLCAVSEVVVDPDDGIGRRVSGKVRTVDPWVWEPDADQPSRLSKLRPEMQGIWAGVQRVGSEGLVVRPRD